MPAAPQRGDFVLVRTRRWLVENERSAGAGLTALRLTCVDDDAQGEVAKSRLDRLSDAKRIAAMEYFAGLDVSMEELASG
jgi:hypothetical protein